MNNITKKNKVKKLIKVQPIVKSSEHFTSHNNLPHLYRPMGAVKGKIMKFYDQAIVITTSTTAGFLQSLFAPPQGNAINQRIGDIVYMRGLEMIYTVNAANADVISTCRVIIFQWHPNNGLIGPVVTDILQLIADNVYAMIDVNFGDQFTVIYDRNHNLSGTATNPTSGSNQGVHKIMRPGYQPKVTFAAGATTGSNIIYLLTISDSSVIPFPNLTLKMRVIFDED